MDYIEGSIGRVFIARIDHNEDLIKELETLSLSKNIKAAFFILLGAIGEASLVTGPKEKTIPPDPNWRDFGDGPAPNMVLVIFFGKTTIQKYICMPRLAKVRMYWQVA